MSRNDGRHDRPENDQETTDQYSGHYAVSKALESVKDQEQWLNDQGSFGEALKQLREDLIVKQGGKETITPAELMTIEELVFAHMLMMSAGRFIGEQGSPVNKSRRALFPIVGQWLTLFREVRETAKDLNVLRKDRPKPEPLTVNYYLTNGKAKTSANSSYPSAVAARRRTASARMRDRHSWVFFRAEKMVVKPIQSYKTAWDRARMNAGLPYKWVHNFRRSGVPSLRQGGVPESVAQALTGHKTPSVFRRYDIVGVKDLSVGVEKLAVFHVQQAALRDNYRRVTPLPVPTKKEQHG